MAEISLSQYLQGQKDSAGQHVTSAPVRQDTTIPIQQTQQPMQQQTQTQTQNHVHDWGTMKPVTTEPVNGHSHSSTTNINVNDPSVIAQGPMPVSSTRQYPNASGFQSQPQTVTGQPVMVEADEMEPATESHALAVAHVEEGYPVGAAQLDHGAAEVRDLGWGEDPETVPNLVGGLPNEELWTLIRRFNKVH